MAGSATAAVISAVPATTSSQRWTASSATAGMNKNRLSKEAIDAAIFRRFKERDFDNIDRIYKAYMEYFNHIKFRKEWSKPRYERQEVDTMFQEAAEYVYRIRQHLDAGKQPGDTTLRVLDGEAQKFLHSDAAGRLIKQDQAAFVTHLVHATFSDAKGYVEGTTPEALNNFVARLQRHRFSPADHLRHILLENLETIDGTNLEATDPERPLHFVEEQSPEDKAWRQAIANAYETAESTAKALECRREAAAALTAAAEAEAKAAVSPPVDDASPKAS